MRERLVRLSKRKGWRSLRWILLIVLLMLLLISLAVLFVRLGWSAGFGKKTLWDWLDLLIIPAVLGLGALWLNGQTQRVERKIASERNQEAALQAYLDRMTDLLLKGKLRDSDFGDEVQTVARTRTLTVLRGLEKERKSAVVWFLVESGLISTDLLHKDAVIPIISLAGAELSGVDLTRANLTGADLSKANLSQARLMGAHLNEADLRAANLLDADLSAAILREASLDEANLTEAVLFAADLTGARVTPEQLSRARDLGWATMPDGTEYAPGTLAQEPPPPETAAPAADSGQEPTVDNPQGEGK